MICSVYLPKIENISNVDLSLKFKTVPMKFRWSCFLFGILTLPFFGMWLFFFVGLIVSFIFQMIDVFFFTYTSKFLSYMILFNFCIHLWMALDFDRLIEWHLKSKGYIFLGTVIGGNLFECEKMALARVHEYLQFNENSKSLEKLTSRVIEEKNFEGLETLSTKEVD